MHASATQFLDALILLALLAVAAACLRHFGSARDRRPSTARYEALPAFLTPAERSFFGVLQQGLASDFQIFAKVRLADIIRPVHDSGRSGWQSAFNRITGKHVDFLLCDPASLSILAVIELDDSTHQRLGRALRDKLVDSALADAGIPILRVSARHSYSPAQLRGQVEDLQQRHRLLQQPSAAINPPAKNAKSFAKDV